MEKRCPMLVIKMAYKKDILPDWAGARRTFMRAPLREIDELEEGMFAILGVPSDFTGSPGPRYGPQAIRNASIDFIYHLRTSVDSTLVDVTTGRKMRYPDKLMLADVGDANIYPCNIQKTTHSIRDAVFAIKSRGAFPIVLGGDHYITYPSFMGLAEAAYERGEASKMGYIQFDAYLDATDDNPLWGKYFHGTMVRRIAEMDIIDPPNMAFIGINGSTRKECWDFVKKNGAHMFTMYDIRNKGIEEITRQASELAGDGCDLIYVTIDIDVCDVVFAPGTGATTIGGLSHMDLLKAIDVIRASKVGSLDVVEVAPNLDNKGVTQTLAAELICSFVAPKLFYLPE